MATGVKLANHGLKVICVHGDGDGYGEGGNHFLHAARRNIGLVDLVQNNHVYGLTKGQYSPTSDPGSSPRPRRRARSSGPSTRWLWPSRRAPLLWRAALRWTWRISADLIAGALNHRGYALIDVLQPCVTFNRAMRL